MFNFYKFYEGDKSLKVYPTWEPCQQGERIWITQKYEKVSLPLGSSIASPTQQPSRPDLNAPPFRKLNLAIKVAKHGTPPNKCNMLVNAPHLPNGTLVQRPQYMTQCRPT